MRQSILAPLVIVIAFLVLPAKAQLGNVTKIVKNKSKTETRKTDTTKKLASDSEYFYVGANDLEETTISGLKVCSDNYKGKINSKNEFKQWFDEISPTAQLKMFEMGRCELMGFHIINKPGRKYRKVDDLAERAEGLSVYQVKNSELALVKKFEAPGLYVVVVPEVVKSGLKLTDLNLCVKPEQKDYYRKKAKGVSNCHNLKQSLYTLNQYKKYPSEYATNSALYFEKDFQTLNKQGKFKSFKIYKLVSGKLVAEK